MDLGSPEAVDQDARDHLAIGSDRELEHPHSVLVVLASYGLRAVAGNLHLFASTLQCSHRDLLGFAALEAIRRVAGRSEGEQADAQE